MEEMVKKQKNITIDDVRTVIAQKKMDIEKVGGTAIRAELGRGSLATIQKHLKSIREERHACEQLDIQTVELDDKAIIEAIKVNIRAGALAQLAVVQSKIDENNITLEQAEFNNDELCAELITLEEQVEALKIEQDTVKDELQHEKTKVAALNSMLDEKETELEKIKLEHDSKLKAVHSTHKKELMDMALNHAHEHSHSQAQYAALQTHYSQLELIIKNLK